MVYNAALALDGKVLRINSACQLLSRAVASERRQLRYPLSSPLCELVQCYQSLRSFGSEECGCAVLTRSSLYPHFSAIRSVVDGKVVSVQEGAPIELRSITKRDPEVNVAITTIRNGNIYLPCGLYSGKAEGVRCNECDKVLEGRHYHCHICDGGNYDVCIECYPGDGLPDPLDPNLDKHCQGKRRCNQTGFPEKY